MKCLTRCIFCLCLLNIPHLMLAQEQKFADIRATIETAVDSLAPEKLVELDVQLTSLIESTDPQVKKYAYYYRGYANYRLHSSFPNIGEEQQEKYLDEAVKMFEKDVAIDPKFAEAYALLGSCYGIKASGFFSGMKYGPKSNNAMSKAKKLAPDNPRVALLDAIGTLYKPSMFGGSTEGAIEGFQRAAELFNDWQPPNEFAPRWGDAEVYAWLGQGYAKAEEYEKAKAAFRKALNVKPGYPWVKELLLPELKAKSE